MFSKGGLKLPAQYYMQFALNAITCLSHQKLVGAADAAAHGLMALRNQRERNSKSVSVTAAVGASACGRT